MKVDVTIVGAGPAGMFLAHLLHRAGRSVTVLERQQRNYVENRVRAGVLERGTVALLEHLELGNRVRAEGLSHEGVNLVVDGEPLRIDLHALTGSLITVYGQQEVMKDLFNAAEDRGIDVRFGVDEVTLQRLDAPGEPARVQWQQQGEPLTTDCQFVVGCDGGHGVTARYLSTASTVETAYPFGWLGILADVPPVNEELIYCRHERGFALASMRSPTRSRYYVQCPIDAPLADWPDERIWDEICTRLGPEVGAGVTRGASFEKSIAPLRSSVTEPMQRGRLFIAGDAAHIVPPTGAKGLNLAVSDVLLLAEALVAYFDASDETALGDYSRRALARVWKAQRFSWWFTRLTHRFDTDDSYQRRLQRTEFDYLRTSVAQQRVFAENYVGLPMTGETA